MPYHIRHTPCAAALTVGLLTLVALGTGGCATPRTLDRIALATINDEAFTAQDLQDDYESLHGGHGILLAGKGALRQFLDRAIERRLLVQEAYRIGLDRDPGIEERLQNIRRAQAREGLLKDRVEAPIPIDAAEVQRAAERLRTVFDVRRIVVPSFAQAQAILTRVRAGEDFGQVSSEVSIGAGDRQRGGLLLGVSWGAFPPEIEDRLYRLQEGEVSDPFATADGWTILKVEHRIEREQVDIEAARPSIENVIRLRVKQARLEALRAELMRRWTPAIHEQRIVAENFFGADAPDIALVEIGRERIGLREFRENLRLDVLQRLPEEVALFQIRRFLEDSVVFDRLVMLEALRLGYGSRPEVEREIRRVRNTLLLEKIMSDYVYAAVSVTDDEVATYYREHPKEFSRPVRAKVRSILVASEEEAGRLRDAIARGKDFAALAREQSRDATTGPVGGEMGWMVEGRTRPPFSGIVFTLLPGEAALAKDGDGYRVVQVEEREEALLRPLEEVRQDARARTLAAKQRQEARRWINKLRDGSTVQIQEAGIIEAEQAYQEMVKAKIGQRRGSKN